MTKPTVAEVADLVEVIDSIELLDAAFKQYVRRTFERLVGPLEMKSYPYLNIARRHDVDYGVVLQYLDQIKNNNWPSENPVVVWPKDNLDYKHRAVFGETVYAWRRERERQATTEGTGNNGNTGCDTGALLTTEPGEQQSVGGGVDDGGKP